ncbi:MAG: GGDEF domain-containing protein [Acidimicrobiales bacterium]
MVDNGEHPRQEACAQGSVGSVSSASVAIEGTPVMVHAAWSGYCREREQDHYGDQEIEWPSTEAMDVVAGLMSYRGSEDADMLRGAAEAWSASNADASIMMTRLSWLREVLQVRTSKKPEWRYSGSFHDLIDYVMTCASRATVQQLESVARFDQLTGCGNRTAMEDEAQRLLAQAFRTGRELSIAVLDLDGLKEINDCQGHPAGDASLKKLVEVARGILRDTDSIFRIGGDEFMVFLPLASGEKVDVMMERALASGAPSFSWGVATYPGDGREFDALFGVADEQLYQRRAEVRNIVGLALGAGAAVAGGTVVGEGAQPVDLAAHRNRVERSIAWLNERTVAVGASVAVLVLVVFTVALLANALGGKAHPIATMSGGASPAATAPRGSGFSQVGTGTSKGTARASGASAAPVLSASSGSNPGPSALSRFDTAPESSGSGSSSVPASSQSPSTGTTGTPKSSSSGGSGGKSTGTSGSSGTGTGTSTGKGSSSSGSGLVSGLTHTLSSVPLAGGVAGGLTNALGLSSGSSGSSGTSASSTSSPTSTKNTSRSSTSPSSSSSSTSSSGSGGLLGGLLGGLSGGM